MFLLPFLLELDDFKMLSARRRILTVQGRRESLLICIEKAWSRPCILKVAGVHGIAFFNPKLPLEGRRLQLVPVFEEPFTQLGRQVSPLLLERQAHFTCPSLGARNINQVLRNRRIKIFTSSTPIQTTLSTYG